MRLMNILVLCVTAVVSAPADNLATRIIGGEYDPIKKWPSVADVLFSWNSATFEQFCGSTILSHRTVLTAAHCINFHPVNRFRVRVGSAVAGSGGTSHSLEALIPHPFYNPETEDYDIGLIRTAHNINFTLQVQPAKIAQFNYTLGDKEIVHALGWGPEHYDGPHSDKLREVQIWTINQSDCERRYGTQNVVITNNMLCAGWLDIGGRGQCQSDGGGPLFHNDTVVGVFSFSYQCGVRFFPGVNTRVSRFYNWISANL